METKIRIGISSCLLGNKVRYDGSHKWDRYITDTSGQIVDVHQNISIVEN